MSSGHFCYLCISFIAIVMVTFEPVAQAQENKVEVESTVRSQIMDLERQVYDAAKKRDATSVRNLLADDSLDVGENGIWGKERSAESISSHEKHPGIELTAYSLSDWQFRKASEDVNSIPGCFSCEEMDSADLSCPRCRSHRHLENHPQANSARSWRLFSSLRRTLGAQDP